ncbi:FliH/SctL family protein [Pelosinus baikalensis]|uniref:Flagellar assembly protein FliH n=1 Tax=Pelosinus baikalensis TaxID=2892015 RepID=A0ABS8HP40_9FIRM|nr:FliH/SctL family protein [Pelosinus baikalensis]MCC5464946.1 flagellar assembly protein FliH [Pelosinus baikalensis]
MANIIRFACMQMEPLIINNNMFIDDNVEVTKELIEVSVDTSVADEIIASAKEEAAVIIDEAKKDANQCMHEANQQVEQLKQQAHDDGYQKGYQQGLEQGKQSGLEEMQSLIDNAVEKTQQMLTLGEKEAKEMILAAERQIIEIALAVAGKVLACQIEENPLIVLPIVKNALEKVKDQEQIVLRVSNNDFDIVLQAKQEFQNMVGCEQALTIVADRTVTAGSCVIDTSYGVVDAKIDTQFDALRKALQGVLP